MLLHGICEEARGNREGALARSGQNLAANGSNGGIVRNVDVIQLLLSTQFVPISQCCPIFTFLHFWWLEAGQILARSDQNLARSWPDAGQHLARIWPDSGRNLPEPGEIRAKSGQKLARSWQDPGNVLPSSISNHDRKPSKSSQNLASFSPDRATIEPDSSKILPEFGPILARFGSIRARSCQSLARLWAELARIWFFSDKI